MYVKHSIIMNELNDFASTQFHSNYQKWRFSNISHKIHFKIEILIKKETLTGNVNINYDILLAYRSRNCDLDKIY